MGNYQHEYGFNGQQSESGRPFIPTLSGSVLGNLFQRCKKMAETKIVLLLLNVVGLPVYFLGIVSNLDNIRSAVLILLGLIYALIQIYFLVVWGRQKTRMRELDIQIKEKQLRNDP